MADRRLFDRPDADHRFHDLLLVAAYAAADLDAGDAGRARALVAGCDACADLVADLRSIAAATAHLPPRPRTRDFRLRPEDAERLRPHGIARVRTVFDGRRLQLARPLATGLTMLGLVGILVTSLPSFSLGGAATAPATTSQVGSDTGPAAPAASGEAAAPSSAVDLQGQPSADVDARPAQGGEASGEPMDLRSDEAGPASPRAAFEDASMPAGGEPRAAVPDDPSAAGTTVIRLASLAALAVGLGLLLVSTLIRRPARRS